MEDAVRPRELELPLQLQFAMRKAELEAQEMTWDGLYTALLNLYQRRLIEWAAIKDLLADENIEIEFDHPTQLELVELAMMCQSNEDEDEDDDDDDREFSVF
jgi:tRNA splicing endonuclease